MSEIKHENLVAEIGKLYDQVTKLQAENERLKQTIGKQLNGLNKYVDKTDLLQAENEELHAEKEKLRKILQDVLNDLSLETPFPVIRFYNTITQALKELEGGNE